ncbi:lamin tail domain-containing protein [Streptomyces humi]
MSVSVTARRVTAAAAVAAACVGGLALPAAAAGQAAARPHDGAVVISAVQYDSPGRDDGTNWSVNKEWVDVTNTSGRAVNLDGWTLSDEAGDTYTFDRFRLDGRSTVRVHTGIGRDRAADVYQDRRTYVWDNYSGTATLRNDHGRFIDEVSWGYHRGGGHWIGEGDHRGRGDHRFGDGDHRTGGDHRGRGDHRFDDGDHRVGGEHRGRGDHRFGDGDHRSGGEHRIGGDHRDEGRGLHDHRGLGGHRDGGDHRR